MKHAEPVIKFLSQLGLDFFESKVFMTLLENGPMTVLNLSRVSDISRTNVYRIVDRLKESGLVEERIKGSRTLINPAPVSKLELLIQEQENRSDILRKTFPEIRSLYEHGGSEASIEGSKFRFFKETTESIREINSIIETSSELKAILPFDYSHIFGEEFGVNIRRNLQQNKVEYKELLLSSYTRYSKIDDLIIYNLSKTFQSRTFDFNISNDQIILISYNRVFVFYKSAENIVGYSTENTSQAKFNSALFNLLWESSSKLS